jgi:hypothetical protein
MCPNPFLYKNRLITFLSTRVDRNKHGWQFCQQHNFQGKDKMNKFFKIIAANIVLSTALSTSALAANPVYTQPVQPPEFDIQNFSTMNTIEMNVGSAFTGFGASVSFGDTVMNTVENSGYSATDIDLSVVSNDCTISCSDRTNSAFVSAGNHTFATGWAEGATSDIATTSQTQGQSQAMGSIELIQMNMSPVNFDTIAPAPAPVPVP